jgi:hypothetical protein
MTHDEQCEWADETHTKRRPSTEAGRRLRALIRDVANALEELGEVVDQPVIQLDDPVAFILAIEAEAAAERDRLEAALRGLVNRYGFQWERAELDAACAALGGRVGHA